MKKTHCKYKVFAEGESRDCFTGKQQKGRIHSYYRECGFFVDLNEHYFDDRLYHDEVNVHIG